MEPCEHIDANNIRDNLVNVLIYKDECMRCFANPEGEEGLNVCLKCLQGFCSEMGHSQQHFEKSGHPIIMNIKKVPILIEGEAPKKEITKLAIGKEGGADVEDPFETYTSVRWLQCDLEVDKTGAFIAPIVDAILLHKSAFFESQVGEWEQEIKEWDHVKNLDQSESTTIPEKALAGCKNWDLKTNLWLCMTWGNLGCGRAQYGGAPGNGHGVAHYEETKHPVSCKLGTITPQGTASLYWYGCDDDVEDNQLKVHLQTLGIDMGVQIKTEKTMTEINLEKNLALTLSKIVEEGRTLTPQFGPGYTGMNNLGNSCYLNSVVQMLFSFDSIRDQYFSIYEEHHKSCEKLPQDCFDWQMSKIAYGLFSGKYSEKKEWKKPEHELQSEEEKEEMDIYQDGIKPQMLKNLIGKGHEEFSSGRQQDAQEYIQYLFDKISQGEREANRVNPCQLLDFDLEHKYQCNNCNGVAFVNERTNQLNLLITGFENDQEEPENYEMKTAFERYFGDEIINKDCPKCQCKQDFTKSTRLLNFPAVLMIVMQRFTFQNWTPTKIKTSVDVSIEDLDMEGFKAPGGIQPGEEALPDGGEVEVEVEAEVNADMLNQCLMMGLPELPAKHALHNTGNQNADAAVTWYFSNMDNPDIQGPLPTVKKKVKQAGFGGAAEEDQKMEAEVDENALQMLVAMCFPEERVRKVLPKCDNNFDRALDYLTSHAPEDDEAEGVAQDLPKWEVDPNPGNYNLHGFITHLGDSIHSGHYVAHIQKDDNWV
jgi:ubiquitin carboxyl-terminal hydrolase 5/13